MAVVLAACSKPLSFADDRGPELLRSGASSRPYSPKCLEGLFSELRLNGVLRTSRVRFLEVRRIDNGKPGASGGCNAPYRSRMIYPLRRDRGGKAVMSGPQGKVLDLRSVFGLRATVTVPSGATGGAYVEMDVTAQPGSATTIHYHPEQEETYRVLEGTLEVFCDG